MRERHKQRVMDAVARERDAAARRDGEARQAQAALDQQAAAKADLWRDASTKPGGLSVDGLRRASGWSRALDAQIARAGESARQAQGRAHLQQLRLEDSRRELRAAVHDLDKAERLQREARATQRREAEERQQDAAEEASVQAWSARKA